MEHDKADDASNDALARPQGEPGKATGSSDAQPAKPATQREGSTGRAYNYVKEVLKNSRHE